MPSLARTIGRATAGYLRVVGRSTRIAGADAARERLAALHAGGRKVVLVYWTEEILPLVLAAWKADVRLGPGDDDIEFMCDDSLGGRITAEVLARFGRRARIIHWSQSAARVRDVQELLRTDSPLGLAVDGTGPWGRVLPSIPRLIQRCGGVAVPIVAVGNFSFLRIRARLALPRPGGRLACAVGDPIELADDLPDAAQALAAGLDRARRSAWSTLGAEGPPRARLLVAAP